MKKYWIVIRCNSERDAKNGGMKGKSYRQHESLKVAQAEAARLSNLFPGKFFGVFEAKEFIRVDIEEKKEVA